MKNLTALCISLWMFCLVITANAADNMAAFPPAEAGMTRYVVHLQEQTDEFTFKIELIAGKTVKIDNQNRYFFSGGQIEEKVIDGWGFTRYVVSKLGPMAGTLMAVDPEAPKVERFITVGSNPYFIRYNSRLPVVMYVPEGVEMRYRIWSAGPEMKITEKGSSPD